MSKRFTDIFIQRPVLATVVSLLIFFLGLRAIFDLQVRQFPKMENTVVTVTTSYPGASAKLIQGFITTRLEKVIASADGIDYLTSESTDNQSTIKAFIKLNFNPNEAFTSVMSKVAEVRGQLPRQADEPVITKDTGSSTALMYLGFSSQEMSREQITDYISRVVQPQLETVSGVAQAKILGATTFAMRIWLNPKEMAAFGVTPEDVIKALVSNNFQSAAGSTKGEYVITTVDAQTDVQNEKGFKNIVIKEGNGFLVRLKDIAKVQLGAENYNSSVIFNGNKAVFVAINSTPTANPLDVITHVKQILPDIKADYPPTLQSKIVYDATKYIRSSIREVIKTILEATIIVILVIFLFLGSLRTVIVPVVTIPLSLIGVCALMLALGYSLNLLTLLSMVLAIGMVVDDAIVVIENIYRHIEGGMKPPDAAIKGAREIANPVISMTITLAAVYAPIGFMGGLTGALFKEFAFTLASAVVISGIIALTLSPMMCSKLLTPDISKKRFVHAVDTVFLKIKGYYQRALHGALDFRPATILFAFVVLLSCIFLYTNTKKQLAPEEDQGALFSFVVAPEYANLNYTELYTQQFNKIYRSFPSLNDYFIINGFNGVNSAVAGIILKPWGDRKQSQREVNAIIQKKFRNIAGLQIQTAPPSPLPVSGGMLPIEFVIKSTLPYSQLYTISEKVSEAAQKSGLFLFINNGLKFNKPQYDVLINRSKAAQLGISMQEIGNALAYTLGGNYINRFPLMGRSYKVIPQIERRYRLNPQALRMIYVNTNKGKLVPLSSLVKITQSTQPNTLSHFQQLNSATLTGMMKPGQTMADGLAFLEKESQKLLPQGMSYDYAGQSRQFVQEGGALIYTFIFSIIIIFLVLAAQFESFKDPLVIMISVPMAICGALLPLNWGFGTINIYTQIGLITLIGLISKHGILMVEFANKLRENEGLSIRDAIEKAAAIRLRPVLMTTAAMILGVVPLILASGAGAASRFDIGLVIATGMAIGTLFTLFVVPTMYSLKAKSILLFLVAAGFVGYVLYNLLNVVF